MKPNCNNYRLTLDGKFFIRALEAAYDKSETKEEKFTKEMQRKEFSSTFFKYFFGDQLDR